jgi:two-component sensor histidine kinase
LGHEDAGAGDDQAEMRHRMANVFQLLSTLTRMRQGRTQEGEGRRQLSWMLTTLGALAALQHRLLSPGGDDFAAFLRDMAPIWRKSCAGRPVSIEVAATPVVVREQLASALALIAHELVVNAVAHAFPDGRAGVVRVELVSLDNGRARLSVADDGLGYDPDAVDRAGLGLWLTRGLAAQVRGELTTAHEGGVTSRLEFPVG